MLTAAAPGSAPRPLGWSPGRGPLQRLRGKSQVLRLGAKYGHTAITTGDGRSTVSDFIESNTLNAGGRSGLKIFRPTL
ncbi:hypothetical protein [Archangium sp.]|uniref:hypothetical protein n=1 Tax=Archangium sp. TaxID=1872627 RepID=UPI0039C8A9F4